MPVCLLGTLGLDTPRLARKEKAAVLSDDGFSN
jgi:hypothetical protein